MTDEKKQEYTLRITHANSTRLVVILYEMLMDYMDDAEAAIDVQDRAEFKDSLRKAKGCVRELINSLHLEYEIAGNLYQLYRYVHRELITAETKNSGEPLSICKTVIHGLYEAYKEVSAQDTSDALIENTQVVYAGLTYGRDDVNVSLTDQGANRGFRA